VGRSTPFFQIALAVVVALAAGVSSDFPTADFHVRRIPPFIVTLGMLGITRGLALGLSDSLTINLIGALSSFSFRQRPMAGRCPYGLLAMLEWPLVTCCLNKTLLAAMVSHRRQPRGGAHVRSARLLHTLAYFLAGLLVGLAAVVQTSRRVPPIPPSAPAMSSMPSPRPLSAAPV
jgi:ribose/xylose/arabinose/galactoside ABC-type transport system permease subunit